MKSTLRGKRGATSASPKSARHIQHAARDPRGDLRPATARQRQNITDMLNEMSMKPRELERFTPGRSDSFWHAAKTGRWGNCRPTVQDWLNIKQIHSIGRVFVGKYELLRDDALEVATQSARVTLAVRKLLDDVMKTIEANNG
jgi:hypothetical protein